MYRPKFHSLNVDNTLDQETLIQGKKMYFFIWSYGSDNKKTP